MRFVIAAGGTGGHLFPGLAVAEVLHGRNHQVMMLISEKEIDSLATEKRSEFRFEKIPGVGMPRILSRAVFRFVKQSKAAFDRCRALYGEFRPDAVLGMGGFTSTAPIFAGRLQKVATFVHESNAIPGKANRLNARMVKAVLLGFPECAKYFPRARCEVTGTPVRSSLTRRMDKNQALAAFGLTPEKTTLLVMGGSQGAQGINRAVSANLTHLAHARCQAIHLTGKNDESVVRAAYLEAGIPAFVAGFYHRMEEAYSAADLCIGRAGAASLSELSHFALPSILIPYPHAAENHQELNAKIFAQAGAAVVLHESEIRGDVLAQKVLSFFSEPGSLAEMSARCAAFAHTQAAERVVETMLTLSEEPAAA